MWVCEDQFSQNKVDLHFCVLTLQTWTPKSRSGAIHGILLACCSVVNFVGNYVGADGHTNFKMS